MKSADKWSRGSTAGTRVDRRAGRVQAALVFVARVDRDVVDAQHRSYANLINSKRGNQNYDLGNMPGVSAYVNAAWIYGLYGLEKMSAAVGEPAIVNGIPASEKRANATASFDKLLWNDQQH